jgi:hypothetical protein
LFPESHLEAAVLIRERDLLLLIAIAQERENKKLRQDLVFKVEKKLSVILFKFKQIHNILMRIFYEGNDLNNSLVEFESMSFDQELDSKRKLQLLLPVFQFIQTAIRQLIYKFEDPKVIEKRVVNITKFGVEIPVFAQAAATELTEDQLAKSMDLVKEVLKKLRKNS